MAAEPLLEVRDLQTHIATRRGVVRAVNGVSFSVRAGETLGIVGESGSGKSITCLSVLRLLPQPGARIVGGQVWFEGADLLRKSEREMRALRGSRIAMILQDPLASLNPALAVGEQIAEPLRQHLGLRGAPLRQRVVDLLAQVRIGDPARRLGNYPHQLSGGMRQRIAGAIAISCSPRLLIADEPTTALDVTVQAQYLRLLKEIQQATGLGMIFVTHDLGIVAKLCHRVAVMYGGRIVESGTVRDIFDRPRHPYTIGLLNCLPQPGRSVDVLTTIPGQSPDLANLPTGCSFHPRCPLARGECVAAAPALEPAAEGHAVACWRADETASLRVQAAAR
jgi:oligopeptide/dipeptide ABC transporter ATP-binding protein